MVAREARTAGLSVVLAPGMNLVRELRSGRVYEYFGEDPLLSGTIADGAIHVIEHIDFCFVPRSVLFAVNPFLLQCPEEALHSRVVPHIA